MAASASETGVINKSGRPTGTVSNKRLLLAWFRLFTLSLALIELAFDDSGQAYFGDIEIAAAAILYTVFKLAHPFRWYRTRLAGVLLTGADVLACALLLFLPREMHTPFALYAMNPVLTTALLFPAGVARITGGVTAVYYSVHFFSYPASGVMEHLSSMYLPNLVAIGLVAWLPYNINSQVLQSLWSRAISEDRLKLGREIHDGLCQTIYGLRMELQMLRRETSQTGRLDGRMDRLQGLLDEAEEEARGSMELLRSFSDDRPLLAQMEKSLKHLAGEAGIDFRLVASELEPDVDKLVKLQVFTICEEALRNVVKHSGARNVAVTVNSPDGHLQVTIADDGRGIAEPRLAEGHGLTVMKERAESVGGRFQVISTPGQGTEIRIEVPRKWTPELETIN